MRDVSFSYPPAPGGGAVPVLEHVSLEVGEGAFCLLVGHTGSGKSTLLRLAKPELALAGERGGAVEVFGRDVSRLSVGDSARLVGFVFQDPDAQMVCDSVWHEMSFGLESLGTPPPEMRRRVAETCHFFGIEPWFGRDVATLSGGQRQVLALASALAMRPRLLLLDEPTSMLDPVAEKSFLHALFRVNRELGVTVVVATHRPWPMVDYATCALEAGAGAVREVALGPLRARPSLGVPPSPAVPDAEAVRADDVWFRYSRDAPWVLRGCDLAAACGSVHALVGGNGSGKTTFLRLVAGLGRPSRGRVRVGSGLSAHVALLPQDPKALFVCDSVDAELREWQGRAGYPDEDVADVASRLGLSGLGATHPYDLSGGQQQLLALAKLLLTRPRLLLLDEPTKGLDARAQAVLADELWRLAASGAAVLMASHDPNFVRQVADVTSMLFDGGVAATEKTPSFFEGSVFFRD
jgi:energy-coupling factor transport system ATP-binding protein